MWILSELNHIMYCDSVSFLVIHLCFSWADHWHLFWLLSFLCAYHWFTAKISKSITILLSKLSIHQIIFKSLLFFFFWRHCTWSLCCSCPSILVLSGSTEQLLSWDFPSLWSQESSFCLVWSVFSCQRLFSNGFEVIFSNEVLIETLFAWAANG